MPSPVLVPAFQPLLQREIYEQEVAFGSDAVRMRATEAAVAQLLGAVKMLVETDFARFTEGLVAEAPADRSLVGVEVRQSVFGGAVFADSLNLLLADAPASASAAGAKGDVVLTATHIYFCVDTDTWVRAALAAW